VRASVDMFGLFRTMLALWVMVFHLVDIPVIGPYAVFSFFVLSGFLMTTIMHESYGYDLGGVKRYAINRFLRLYPMYWAAALVSVFAITFATPEYSLLYRSSLYMPTNVQEIIFNSSMIYPSLFPNKILPRLSPPTWALTVEIFYYVCIGLGASRTKVRTHFWVGLSVIYFLLSYVLDAADAHRYSSLFAGTLPFSLGALLYFYKKEIFSVLYEIKLSSPIVLISIYVLNTAFFTLNEYYNPFSISTYLEGVGKYCNIFITLLVIVSLFYRGHEYFSKKRDKIIGDYSYPIYLLHWQCGLLASFMLFESPTRGLSRDGLISFGLSILFVIILSSILIVSIDKNISLVRNRFKANKVIC